MKKILKIDNKNSEEQFILYDKSFTIVYDNYKNKKCIPYRLFFENYSNKLIFDGRSINFNEYNSIKGKIEILTYDIDNRFISNNTLENICFYLKSFSMSDKEIIDCINKYMNNPIISKIINTETKHLSYGQKVFVSIFMSLLIKPNILIIDNLLSCLDDKYKSIILEMFKELNNEITICYFTSNIDDILLGSHVIIYNDNKKIIDSNIKSAFKDLNIYESNNIKLPFIIDLSNKLKYYNKIDKLYFDIEKLVDNI